MFIVDMIRRLTIYSYFSHENGKTVVVLDSTAIRRKYLSSKQFKIDLLTVQPFELPCNVSTLEVDPGATNSTGYLKPSETS